MGDSESTIAAVPVIDPETFEHFEEMRETTLATFSDAKVNATLRAFVDFVHTVCLEYSKYWPREEGIHRDCLAAVADLRYMQGYLSMLSEATLAAGEEPLARLCARLSPRVEKIADALEKMLAEPREGE